MADAEVKTAEMVPKWVPIAEAPLNAPGLVWVADGGERQPNGKRAGRLAFGYVGPYGDGRKARASGFHGDWNITHWMPEPLPPLRGTDMSDGAENVQISPELLERIAAAIDSAREAVPKPRSYEMAHYCMGLEKAAAIARAALTLAEPVVREACARDVLAREAQHYQKCAGCVVASRSSPQRPPHPVDGCGCMNIADAAISALRAKGYVVVPAPKEVDHMDAPGSMSPSGAIGWAAGFNPCRAMLAAAQEAPDDTVRIGAATLAKLADAAETQIIGSYPNAVLYPPQRKAMEAELAPVREAREALRAVTDCSTAAAPRHP